MCQPLTKSPSFSCRKGFESPISVESVSFIWSIMKIRVDLIFQEWFDVHIKFIDFQPKMDEWGYSRFVINHFRWEKNFSQEWNCSIHLVTERWHHLMPESIISNSDSRCSVRIYEFRKIVLSIFSVEWSPKKKMKKMERMLCEHKEHISSDWIPFSKHLNISILF